MQTLYPSHDIVFSDPPLMEEDIPSGQWLCHNCRMTSKPLSSKASSVERTAAGQKLLGADHSEQSRPSTPDLEVIPPKIRSLRNRSSSRTSVSSESTTMTANEKSAITMEKVSLGIAKALEANKKPNPLHELIKAASTLNPKQFELPKELELHTQFPGNDKGLLYFMNT